MSYEIVLFIIAAALEIGAAMLVFTFKDVLHSILALAFVFMLNSAILLMLAQPMLALLQLFIMVGGVATYAFVGASSSSYSRFRHTNVYVLAVSTIVLFLLLGYGALRSAPATGMQNTLSGASISQSLGSSVAMLYVMAVMLFGIGFGSILLMRKMGEDK